MESSELCNTVSASLQAVHACTNQLKSQDGTDVAEIQYMNNELGREVQPTGHLTWPGSKGQATRTAFWRMVEYPRAFHLMIIMSGSIHEPELDRGDRVIEEPADMFAASTPPTPQDKLAMIPRI
jgi:hypothetical protein